VDKLQIHNLFYINGKPVQFRTHCNKNNIIIL